MSDPVTNVEIEDILSSIRRLVSDEGKPVEDGESREEDRLVLTPSLRVPGTDEANNPESDGEDTEAPAASQADAPSHHDPATPIEPEPQGDLRQDDTPHDKPEPAENLRARIAALEETVATREDEWEPDGSGGDDYAGGPVEALPWEDHVEDADQPGADADDTKGDSTDDSTDSAQGAWADRGEENRTFRFGEGRPEQDADADANADADVGDDGAEGNDGDDDASDDMAELFRGEDPVLDEAALREMITDIVRQELQGNLGERITRNVRKLVRREIHRAMASYDLD